MILVKRLQTLIMPDCRRHQADLQTNRSPQVEEILTGLCIDLAEAVVAHLVHEAVEQHRGALAVNSELSGGGVVVVLFDVFARVCASPDADHPQKLVDVCYEQKLIKAHKKNPFYFI